MDTKDNKKNTLFRQFSRIIMKFLVEIREIYFVSTCSSITLLSFRLDPLFSLLWYFCNSQAGGSENKLPTGHIPAMENPTAGCPQLWRQSLPTSVQQGPRWNEFVHPLRLLQKKAPLPTAWQSMWAHSRQRCCAKWRLWGHGTHSAERD